MDLISRICFVLCFCANFSFEIFAQENQTDVLVQLIDSSSTITEDIEAFYIDNYPLNYEGINNVLEQNSNLLRQKSDQYYFKHELARAILLEDHYGNNSEAIRVFTNLKNDSGLKNYPRIYERAVFFGGRLSLHLERPRNAIVFFKESIKLTESLRDSIKLKASLINLGISYSNLQKSDSAIFFYDQAKILQDKGINKYWENLSLNYAAVYQLKGEYKRVISIYNNLIEEYEKKSLLPDPALHYNLAAAHFELGEFNKGLPIIDFAEKIALIDNDLYVLRNIYETKTSVYQDLHDFESALKYEHLKDSIEEVISIESGSHLLDNLQNERQLEKSKEVNKGVKSKLDFESRQKKTILVLSLIVLIGSVVYVIFLRRRYMRRMTLVKSNLALVLDATNDNYKGPYKKREKTTVPNELKEKIKKELKEKELFKNPNVSISLLAKRINSNTTEVSNVVNDFFDMPFRELINTLRIEEARKLLTNPKFDPYSIEGISQIVGYKSISSFNINFKKLTGITPSFYRKKSTQLRKSNPL